MIPITHTVSIYHLVTAEGIEQYETDPSIESVSVTIFPASNDVLAMYPGEGSFSAYQVTFWDDLDIRNGDKVKADNLELILKGKPTVYRSLGHLHIECVGLEEVGT